jgi:glycosyltransferase involved in cell wall biosynthesis
VTVDLDSHEDVTMPPRINRPAAPLVSVILPVRNAEATIEAQLEALSRQTFDGRWELVFSDNGSADRTLDIARTWANRFPAFRVVDASAEPGVSHARNRAAETGGDLLAFCDADDVVEPTWLAELVRAAQTVDLVGGALDHATLNDIDLWPARGGAEGELPRTYGFLPYAIGANCAVWREVFDSIGGWTNVHAGGDDVDFSWRAQLAGYSIGFAPSAVVQYRHRDSLAGLARQVFNYARSEVGIYSKYRVIGARRRPLGDVLRSYVYTVTALPSAVVSRRRRAAWTVTIAENLGRIVGSCEYRIFSP